MPQFELASMHADATLIKALLVSPDIIAIDTVSTKLAQQFIDNVELENVGHIHHGQKHGLETIYIKSLNVRRIRV